ncbi:MAG: OmpH family outer membrane protein [Chlorobi bacterium]|nr:OmpH family outer membrane protein [Chlorobiota bacterium]
MKNSISIIINGVLVVAVAILYILHFTGKNDTQSKENVNESIINSTSPSGNETDIVYVDMDSLLLNYRLSEDLNDAFLQKQEKLKSEISYKASKYEEDVIAFQKKLNRGGFLTQQRAEEEQKKLIERQQQLQQMDAELSNKLMTEQQNMTNQLYDSIISYVEDYNAKHNYRYILGNTKGGGLLYANKGLNITNDIIEGLNERYLGSDK